MADPTPAAPVKSGWKTTELYLAMFACGALTHFGNDLINIVKAASVNPALPPWVAPLLSLAPIVLSGLIVKAGVEYGKLRRDLKLGSPDAAVDVAVAAGDAAAKASPDELATAANK